MMALALAAAGPARRRAMPNPWVGCVIAAPVAGAGGRDGEFKVIATGATEAPGSRHAERVALEAAGDRGRGATVFVTLEPCCFEGRTGPCSSALIQAGVARVVVAMVDPDSRVDGRGIAELAEAGIDVTVGVMAREAEDLIRPFVTHRRSGRPFVVLKLAATLDGRIAAPDGSSKWITGDEARRDVHRLRAESSAVLVGAGTVRADDPELTVRLAGADSVEGDAADARQPLRVVLGRAPKGARVQPALELTGDLRGVLDELGRRDVIQLLVEGGSKVAGEFHRLGLVDRYVVYLAPAFLGGDDGRPLFDGPGAPTMADVWRGRLVGVTRLGEDVRIDVDGSTAETSPVRADRGGEPGSTGAPVGFAPQGG